MEYIAISFMQWWVLAAVFFVISLLMVSSFFMVMALGFAAFITGLAVFLIPLAIGTQIGLFLFLIIAAVWAWRRRMKYQRSHTFKINKDAQKYIGLKMDLEEAIEDGIGSVLINGNFWYVKGPDLPKGTRVVLKDYQHGFYLVETITKRIENDQAHR